MQMYAKHTERERKSVWERERESKSESTNENNLDTSTLQTGIFNRFFLFAFLFVQYLCIYFYDFTMCGARCECKQLSRASVAFDKY